jgi:hypothetical protein
VKVQKKIFLAVMLTFLLVCAFTLIFRVQRARVSASTVEPAASPSDTSTPTPTPTPAPTPKPAPTPTTAPNRTITMISNGGGTVSPSGAQTWQQGSVHTVTAAPSNGHYFVVWTVINSCGTLGNATSATTTFTVGSVNGEVHATFALTVVPTPSPTPSPTPTPKPSLTPTPKPTPTPTPAPTLPPTPSQTPQLTGSPTLTPTPTLFSEGFESGNLNAWNDTYGMLSINSQIANSGAYSAESVIGASNENLYYHVLDSPSSTIDFREYVYVNSTKYPSTSGDYYQVGGFSSTLGGNYGNGGIFIFNSGGTLYWGLYYRNFGNFSQVISSHAVSIGWCCVEMRHVTSSGSSTNGEEHLWLNGIDIKDVTGISNNDRTLASAVIGGSQKVTNSSDTWNYYVDDVAVDSSYIGPTPSASSTSSPSPSLTPAPTSTSTSSQSPSFTPAPTSTLTTSQSPSSTPTPTHSITPKPTNPFPTPYITPSPTQAPTEFPQTLTLLLVIVALFLLVIVVLVAYGFRRQAARPRPPK